MQEPETEVVPEPEPPGIASLIVLDQTGNRVPRARVYELEGVNGTPLGVTNDQGRLEVHRLPLEGLVRAGFRDAREFSIDSEGLHEVTVLAVAEQPELSSLRGVGLEERYEAPVADRVTLLQADGSVHLERAIDSTSTEISQWTPEAGEKVVAVIPLPLDSITHRAGYASPEYRLMTERTDGEEKQAWLLDVREQRIAAEFSFPNSDNGRASGSAYGDGNHILVIWMRRPWMDVHRINRQTGESTQVTLEYDHNTPRPIITSNRIYLIGVRAPSMVLDRASLEPIADSSFAEANWISSQSATLQRGDEVHQVATDGQGRFAWRSSTLATQLAFDVGSYQLNTSAAIVDGPSPAFFVAPSEGPGVPGGPAFVDVDSGDVVPLGDLLQPLLQNAGDWPTSGFRAARVDDTGNLRVLFGYGGIDSARYAWVHRVGGQFVVEELIGSDDCSLSLDEGQLAWSRCPEFAAVFVEGAPVRRTYLHPRYLWTESRHPHFMRDGAYWRFDRLAPL